MRRAFSSRSPDCNCDRIKISSGRKAEERHLRTSSPDPARLGVACTSEGAAAGGAAETVEGVGEGEGIESGGGLVIVGVGKLIVFAIGGATRGVGAGAEGGADRGDWVPAKTAPLSRLTRLGVGVLPEKNSPAERAASEEGAGGKMSDWKLSAYNVLCQLFDHL